MTRRRRRYDPDIGGVTAPRRRAVADRTALGPDPAPRRGCRGWWPLALVLAAAPLAMLAGWWWS